MKIIISKYEYRLYEIDPNELILSANYGTVVELVLNIKLTEKETDAYRKEGIVFLDKLADDIRSNADKYKFRHIKQLPKLG